MPFKEVLEQEDLLAGPYGSYNFDEDQPFGDPFWTQFSDDGQILFVIDQRLNEHLILEYDANGNEEWSVQKRIAGDIPGSGNAVGDIKPGTHTILYNDRNLGGITEYNYDTDSKELLFMADVGTRATYWPVDRTKLQVADDSSVLELRNRNGTVDSSVDVGQSLSIKSFYWQDRTGTVFSVSGYGKRSVTAKSTSDGSLKGYFKFSEKPLHIYARKAYMTIGFERDYAVVMEPTGVFRRYAPMRTNVITIRDPPGREGVKFCGTYYRSVYEWGEGGLDRPICRPVRKKSASVSSGGGELATSIHIPEGQKLSITTQASATGSDIEHYVAVPNYWTMSGYGTIFREWDSGNADPQFRIDERTGNNIERFEVSGHHKVQVGVKNNSASSVDANIIAERG